METPLPDEEKQSVLYIFKLVKESWQKVVDTPFYTEMIKKTAEVTGVSVATVYDIIKEDNTKDQAPPPCQWKHKKNCTPKIKDQTKIDIAKVYHYLEQEYEELKNRYVGLDLTRLSKFSRRTALATGVSESLVLEIMQEEESQNTDMQQEQIQKQSLRRLVQTESSSEEDGFESNDEQSSTVHGLSNRDQTKIDIAKVYHYFEQECEELKSTYVGLGLTPLWKFRQRTALATGVSQATVVEILQEEERRRQSLAGVKEKPLETFKMDALVVKEEPLETNVEEIEIVKHELDVSGANMNLAEPLAADETTEPRNEKATNGARRPCKRGPGRGKGVPPPPSSTSPVPPPHLTAARAPSPRALTAENVSAPARTGRAGASRSGGRAGYGSERPRPGPHNIEDVIRHTQELPPGHVLETPIHAKRMRMSQPSVPAAPTPPPRSLGGDDEVASTSRSAIHLEPSASCSMQPPPPRQNLRNNLVNYGSDADSEESDENEDDTPQQIIPRVFRAMMTPWDQDDDEDAGEAGAGAAPAADLPPSATDQPWSFFDFQWRDFPNPPIPPESRRETFSQNNVGPTIPHVDPYDIFVAIWDRQFMEYIASETNRYAQQVAAQLIEDHNLHPRSHISQWVDTTADELYSFLGIILAMGVVVKSRLEEYWGASPDIFSTPGYSAHMTVDRFTLLNKCLHFANNDDMCAVDLDVSGARLFKIRPVLSHLNSKFANLYVLSQNIALDESLLMWKGWLDISQLISHKAATRGIKTYEVCESQTGYLWRFEVHSHRAPARQPENPLDKVTPAIVLRLTQGLEYKGYTLWMDSFYNSPALARRLKSLGFDCVGTLRTDRQFIPEALHNLTRQRMRRGDVSGLTSGDVDVMVWRDSNRVATISTYHGNAVETIRGSTKPILIHDFNIMMGRVDKKDQMLAMYPVERKRTNVWYKKLFRRLLNVSVLNSLVIHRANAASSRTSTLTHRRFRINLVKSLLSRHNNNANPLPRPNPQNVVDVTHRISMYAKSGARGVQRLRRKCAVCRKHVHTFCVGCDQTVCLEPCFLTLHSGR